MSSVSMCVMRWWGEWHLTRAASKGRVHDGRVQNELAKGVSVTVSNQTELVRNCNTQKPDFYFSREATPFDVGKLTTGSGVLNHLLWYRTVTGFWFTHTHNNKQQQLFSSDKENYSLYKCSSVLPQIIRWLVLQYSTEVIAIKKKVESFIRRV